MSFTTKKYTRPVLINELRKINARNYSNLNTFASTFSPRAGVKSAKLSALKSLVGSTKLKYIFNNSNGVSAKTTLISLLKNT